MCDKNSSYNELLQRDEWRRKRLEILNRDRNKCRNCGNYNHLNDLCLGYIGRNNSSGELLLGRNISGLKKTSIEGMDFDNRTYINNRCTHLCIPVILTPCSSQLTPLFSLSITVGFLMR